MRVRLGKLKVIGLREASTLAWRSNADYFFSDENFIGFIQCALSEVKVAIKLKKKSSQILVSESIRL